MDYLLAFFRLTITFLFAWSLSSKVKDFNSFVRTINQFKLTPENSNKLIAFLFLFLEATVLFLMILGGRYVLVGSIIATFVLSIFTIAMTTVLFRKIKTACNCFGTSQKAISHFDIFRNLIFILCSIIGSVLVFTNGNPILNLTSWVLISIISFVFVMVVSSFEDIINFLR